MDSLVSNYTTAQEAMALEDGAQNPFLPGALHSAEYFADLKRRRDKYPVCSPEKRQQFLNCYNSGQATIVVGNAGCGKTTQLVQFILFDERMNEKIVGCTQPRGSAASSAATQLAHEMEVPLGGVVGCQSHSDDGGRSGDSTRLRFLKDDLLLQEIHHFHSLPQYGCIVVDEAHERTKATDMMLALLKHVMKIREDFKVVIISEAITDLGKLASFFETRNFFRAPGQAYAVQILHLPRAAPSYLVSAGQYVELIVKFKPKGNILLFLARALEIEAACAILRRKVPTLQVVPLCSGPPSLETLHDSGFQKCFLATSLAEVSAKIPGIVYVVAVPISKPMAHQRAARAGREQDGICYRLYTEDAFNRLCPLNDYLEIHKSEIMREVLILKSCGFHQLSEFNFVDPPPMETVWRALDDLRAMDYIDADARITAKGSIAAGMPINPAWYNAFLKARDLGCLGEIVTIACLLSAQGDIFVKRNAADSMRRHFNHPRSDHICRLKAFDIYIEGRNSASDDEPELVKWCQMFSINPEVAEESLAAGFYHKAAILDKKAKDRGIYKTVHGNHPVAPEPDSCLAGMSFEWVVYDNMHRDGTQYMYCVTAIDPAWIMDLEHFQDHSLVRKFDGVTLKNAEIKASLDRARAQRDSRPARRHPHPF
ncbi:hypothetical protein ACHAPT_008601 [Fusarium lateritium]